MNNKDAREIERFAYQSKENFVLLNERIKELERRIKELSEKGRGKE